MVIVKDAFPVYKMSLYLVASINSIGYDSHPHRLLKYQCRHDNFQLKKTDFSFRSTPNLYFNSLSTHLRLTWPFSALQFFFIIFSLSFEKK